MPIHRIKSYRSPLRIFDDEFLTGNYISSFLRSPLNHQFLVKSPVQKNNSKNKKTHIKYKSKNCDHKNNFQCSHIEISHIVNGKSESYTNHKCKCNTCDKEWEKNIENGNVIFDNFQNNKTKHTSHKSVKNIKNKKSKKSKRKIKIVP